MTKKCVKYAFMFVICLVVPCLFCFAGCSNTAVAVTEQEWETAFTGMTNYSIIGGISNTDADYGEFEYDSSTHTYKSKTSFNVSGGFAGTNGVISFTNGKCTQISYQYTQNNATVDVVITIDYAVTDMPSDLPE